MANREKTNDILTLAVDCDKIGLIFQSLYYYAQGIPLLMKLAEEEEDMEKEMFYYERIKQYIDRSEGIKLQIKAQLINSEKVTTICIPEGADRNDYDVVFGEYLNDRVHEILLEEPLLDEKFHFQDLTIFLELLVRNCPNLSYIRITANPSKRDLKYQFETLKGMQEDLEEHLITMSYVIDDVLIEPKIILNTGFIIKMDRGLHYFQLPESIFNLGLCEYRFRKCHESTIDVYETKPFEA